MTERHLGDRRAIGVEDLRQQVLVLGRKMQSCPPASTATVPLAMLARCAA
jgi:hypothetical protein